MSTLAQEEVQRLFSHHNHLMSHPEDLDHSDHSSVDEKNTTEPAFSHDPNQDSDDDDDLADRVSALTTSKSTFILPAAAQYANTGPKGVIADAQSFTRAKRDAYKLPMTNVTNIPLSKQSSQEKDSGSSSEEEEDARFMEQWRAHRLAEIAADADSHRLLHAHHGQHRRISPSRRAFGRATRVDATGYLDAVEKVAPETTVVVMIYDAQSAQSDEVEEEIDILAYKYGHVRFVKLDQEIAEMEHIETPALLAYRDGDVFATISGAKKEGLEQVLEQQGIFV